MADQPVADKQEANPNKGKGEHGPESAILKAKNDTEQAYKTDHETHEPGPKIQIPQNSVWTWIKRKSEEASLADWAMVFFTFVLAATTIVFTVYAKRQWKEMHESGTDTHDLAVAAGKQAEAAKVLAEQAKTQTVNTTDEVTQLKGMVTASSQQATTLGGQLSIMRKQLEAADRAWISVGASISGPLTYDARNGVFIGFRFILNDTGRSPAQGVHISAELVTTILLSNTEAEQKRICEGHAKALASGAHGYQEYTVFPGEPDIEEESIQLSIKDIDAFYSAFEKAPIPRPDFVPIGLVGCVDYTFLSSPIHHQTGFAFQILTREGGNPFMSQTPIAGDRLMLMKTPLGHYFVN